MYKVEDGVPLPNDCQGRKGMSKYPFPGMEVGQSFVVENYYKGELARVAAHTYANRSGKKFKSKRQPDGSIRIWRME